MTKEMKKKVMKARYWVAVMYPESMLENWQEYIDELIQLPFAYCIQDKCKKKDGSQLKPHVHIIIAWKNNTTYNAALEVFQKLGDCNKCEKIDSIERMYEYIIHNTDDCKKKGKYLYDESERILGNGFSISNYVTLSNDEVKQIKTEIFNMISSKERNIFDFYELSLQLAQEDDERYFEVLTKYQSFFYNLVRSKNYHFRDYVDRR